MNINDKINRSRPGRASRAGSVARHARKCVICKHPDREAIEEQFVHWIHADRIVQDHDLNSRANLYRHAYATGLYDLRRHNMRYALEHLIEDAIHAPVSGDCVIRAVRAHACLTAKGRWIEPPKELILSRRILRPRPAPCSSRALPSRTGETRKEFRSLPARTAATPSNAPATSDTVSLSLPERSKGPSITDVSIATPKQLKIAATNTKQTTDVISNRYKKGPLAEAD
jgi:hypothetical protein